MTRLLTFDIPCCGPFIQCCLHDLLHLGQVPIQGTSSKQAVEMLPENGVEVAHSGGH